MHVSSIKKCLARFRIGFMNVDWVVGTDSCASELTAPVPGTHYRLF